MMLGKIGAGQWQSGDWDGVLATGAEVIESDAYAEIGDRMQFLLQAGQVHAARGESVADTLDELARTAPEVTDIQVLWTTVEAAAFKAFAEGRLADAGAIWREGAGHYEFVAPDWLYRAATAALQLSDASTASGDLSKLDATGYHVPVVDAWRGVIRAGLAALGGNVGGSIGLFQAALGELKAIDIPFEEALAAIVMVSVLDSGQPEVRAAAERAREILVGLRARPFLDQLEAALARAPEREPTAADPTGASVSPPG
jgi:hypothetical protein